MGGYALSFGNPKFKGMLLVDHELDPASLCEFHVSIEKTVLTTKVARQKSKLVVVLSQVERESAHGT